MNGPTPFSSTPSLGLWDFNDSPSDSVEETYGVLGLLARIQRAGIIGSSDITAIKDIIQETWKAGNTGAAQDEIQVNHCCDLSKLKFKNLIL